MSNKSIFDPSVEETLSGVFQHMTSPARKVARKSRMVSESVTYSSTSRPSFDKIFNEAFDEEDEFADNAPDQLGVDPTEFDSPDVEGDFEDGDEFEDDGVEDMVSVPKALIDELISYLDDPIGDNDIDDPDFDIPEEKTDYSTLKNVLNNTVATGSVKAKTKTKATKKSGAYTNSIDRSGKASILKNLLASCLAVSHSGKQKSKLEVGKPAFTR